MTILKDLRFQNGSKSIVRVLHNRRKRQSALLLELLDNIGGAVEDASGRLSADGALAAIERVVP